MKPFSLILLVFLSLFSASVLAGKHKLEQIIPEASSVYVPPFDGDKFYLEDRLKNAIIKKGYRLATSLQEADYTITWSYSHGATTYASARISDRAGNIIHVGESKNPGFGTIINKNGATWGCIKRAVGL